MAYIMSVNTQFIVARIVSQAIPLAKGMACETIAWTDQSH